MTLIPYLEAFEWIWRWARPKPKELPPVRRVPRVLIVEDNQETAFLFSMMLKKCCAVEANFAATAEAALALIERNQVDLIFLDMRLTYMNGWELLPLIWRHSPHSFVVITCTLMEDLVKIPPPHRMFSVMVKPIDMDMLKELFEKVKL